MLFTFQGNLKKDLKKASLFNINSNINSKIIKHGITKTFKHTINIRRLVIVNTKRYLLLHDLPIRILNLNVLFVSLLAKLTGIKFKKC